MVAARGWTSPLAEAHCMKSIELFYENLDQPMGLVWRKLTPVSSVR